MGEYATFKGQQVKIGTCEDLYYLRADQAHLVTPEADSLDPTDDSILGVLRFRFPFPDEDATEPGCFEDYDRGIDIPGWTFPEGYMDHGSVQFIAKTPGYNLSIPCPEQYGQAGMSVDMPDGMKVHRNGFSGGPKLVQQGFRGFDDGKGALRAIVSCGACGARASLSLEAAVDVAQAFRDEAERQGWRPELDRCDYANIDERRAFLIELASRIIAGYSHLVTA